MSNRPKPLVLLILDGFGCGEPSDYNAISLAHTPCWDQLQRDWPMTTLRCSGLSVGLPDDQMGNSEVGHIHIGAGRFVPQDLTQVNLAIESGEFFDNAALCQAVDTAKTHDKALHILGLLSNGGIHSHISQIIAMIELAARRGLQKVYLHAFLDGRDTPPQSAESFIDEAEAACARIGVGRIASITGRFYAMDRDKRWERLEQAYRLLVHGQGEHSYPSVREALAAAYARGETDEFVAATAVTDAQGQVAVIDPDDAVVFMNFRADRARELCMALCDPTFDGFARQAPIHRGPFVTLTQYHHAFTFPVAFPPVDLRNGLGEVLAREGLTQLRLAETEKYAHVTFFLNGGTDQPYPGESRLLIPSPNVKTYDLKPEMSGPEVTDALVEAIRLQQYDVIICNYANCDMVGHTGNLEASIHAVEFIDRALQRVTSAVLEVGGQIILTADHGNIEKMRDEDTGQPHTAHTTNLVPMVHIGGTAKLKENGSLSDLAPTMLYLLGIPQPVEMTGQCLVAA